MNPPSAQVPRETWLIERYRASQLAAILRVAGLEKVTGQITLNIAQGTVVGLEVRTRVKENLTS